MCTGNAPGFRPWRCSGARSGYGAARLLRVGNRVGHSQGIPLPFVYTILLPIVGNAAEHAASVLFAMKNKMNISLSVACGSSAQVTILVIPFCVVLGWAINVPVGLNMHEFETAVMFVSVVIVAVFLQDGNSNWLKGLVLILSYVALAGAFYNHSDAELMRMQVQAPAPAVAGGKSL